MHITKATNITSIIIQEIICIISIHHLIFNKNNNKKMIEKYRIFLFYNSQIIYMEKIYKTYSNYLNWFWKSFSFNL